MNALGHILRCRSAGERVRPAAGGEVVEHERQLERVAGAQLTVEGVRAPAEFVEARAAAVRRGEMPCRQTKHQIVQCVGEGHPWQRARLAEPVGFEDRTGVRLRATERQARRPAAYGALNARRYQVDVHLL